MAGPCRYRNHYQDTSPVRRTRPVEDIWRRSSDCGFDRYYLVAVSKSFPVRGMVQCEEGLGIPHCLLMGGIVHASLLGGAFHRLLIDGIDQNMGAELTTFLCSTFRAAVSCAKTAGDKASRAGNMQATMMLCCCDFFMYLPSMTACRACVVWVANRVSSNCTPDGKRLILS